MPCLTCGPTPRVKIPKQIDPKVIAMLCIPHPDRSACGIFTVPLRLSGGSIGNVAIPSQLCINDPKRACA